MQNNKIMKIEQINDFFSFNSARPTKLDLSAMYPINLNVGLDLSFPPNKFESTKNKIKELTSHI